jgi:hypothetical protein
MVGDVGGAIGIPFVASGLFGVVCMDLPSL